MTATTVYLVTVTPYDPGAAANVTLRYATQGYTTAPTDTPANAYFEGRVQIPANYKRSIYESGQTFGLQSIGKGEVVLGNPDGGLDALQPYGWAGWPITIETLTDGAAAYSTRQPYMVGTIEQTLPEWRKLTFRLRDRMDILDVSIQPHLYGGTTTGTAATADGNANMAGKIKPLTFGKVFNITPALANAYDLIYQVNDGAVNSIDAVRTNGAATITATGSDYATIALLRAAVIAPGSYSTCLALGYFRLGGDPQGQVTADVTQGANAAARTAAQITGAILTAAGLVGGTDYSTASITALDTLNSAVCGIYIDQQTTILNAISAVLGSIGGWLLPNRLGVFQVGRLDTPAVTAAATFTASEILDNGQGLAQLNTGDVGYGVPSWRVTLSYSKNYTLQSAGQLAGAVSADLQSRYGQAACSTSAADASVKAAHPSATDMGSPTGKAASATNSPIDTLLTAKADADTEVARRLVMYKAVRRRFIVPVKSYQAIGLNLGDTICLQLARFNLNAGVNFSIIGITENAQTNDTELDVWG